MSGIVPDDKRLGIKKQTEEVLTKIDGILNQIGYNQTKILNAVVYIFEMDQKNAMNEAAMEWMGSNNPPARACVGVILTPDPPVEIIIHAVQGYRSSGSPDAITNFRTVRRRGHGRLCRCRIRRAFPRSE